MPGTSTVEVQAIVNVDPRNLDDLSQGSGREGLEPTISLVPPARVRADHAEQAVRGHVLDVGGLKVHGVGGVGGMVVVAEAVGAGLRGICVYVCVCALCHIQK